MPSPKRLSALGWIYVGLGFGAVLLGSWLWNRQAPLRWKDMSSAERGVAMRDTGEASLDELLEALKDDDADVRLVAVNQLRSGDQKGTERARALIEALKDPIVAVRREAVVSLCWMGADSGPPLYESLKNPDPLVRAGAAQALGDAGMVMGGGRRREPGEAQIIQPILKDLLDDPDPE